ncbi:hypothetical protein ACIBP6_20905 [Nonomuraea terrae]|uniref:hypothetical protein n=1 Tax=Nonomuraea terrae TaxID=2530383 RepID=UPI0037B901D2
MTTVNVRATAVVVVRKEVVKTVGLMFPPGDILLAVEVESPSTKMRDRMFRAERTRRRTPRPLADRAG